MYKYIYLKNPVIKPLILIILFCCSCGIKNLKHGSQAVSDNNSLPQYSLSSKTSDNQSDKIVFADTPKSYVNFNVYIEGLGEGRCSGVHIGDGVILSAGHCIGNKQTNYDITKLIYHVLDPETQHTSVEVVEANEDNFVYHQEIHPSIDLGTLFQIDNKSGFEKNMDLVFGSSTNTMHISNLIDIGLIFTDLKKPFAGSAEIVGQGESNTNYNSLDYFSKIHSQARVYLSSQTVIDSSIDVGKFDNNRVIRFEHIDLHKNKGITSGLVSFLYDNFLYDNWNILEEVNNSNALNHNNLSDDLTDSEKIAAMFEFICSVIEEVDSVDSSFDFCKHKQWSLAHRIISDDIMKVASSDNDNIDNEWAQVSLMVLAFLSKMYSQLYLSMPESTSPKISKFCIGDSGTPIYLEQGGKEVVAGVLSFSEPPKIPAYPGDRFKDIKQTFHLVSMIVNRLVNKASRQCSVLAIGDYLYPYLPWIVLTKLKTKHFIKRFRDSMLNSLLKKEDTLTSED